MEYILNGLDKGILKIELNRPQKRNVLTLDMYTEFAQLLNTAQANPAIRVVLVSATGDNYSAGNDLQDFLDHHPGSGDSPQKQMIDALRVLDKRSSAQFEARRSAREPPCSPTSISSTPVKMPGSSIPSLI
jgi:enoyl-CoA hydratase/carnithine racemase